MTSFKGYLPATTFVMGKKNLVRESFPAISETPATTHSVVSLSSDSKAATPQKAEAVSALTTAKIIFVEATPTLAGTSLELLYKMIDAMGVKRDQAFVTNLVESHVSSLAGKVVVALGDEAATKVSGTAGKLQALRAKVHFLPNGPRVIATYHPAYLLENAAAKKDAWEDLKLAMRELSV
jgi:hypothetical protein